MSKRKKRRFGFFNDFFDFDFEDEIERMQKEMEEMVSRMNQGLREDEFERFLKPGKSKVYGFSLRMGPDGKPTFREFGNIRPSLGPKKKSPSFLSDGRKPLIDVLKGKKEITVIAEVPGAEKKDIHLKMKDGKLIIDVKGKRKYYQEVNIPAKVDYKKQKFSYKNGILEVKLPIKS